MKTVLITGGTGLIGQCLSQLLHDNGYLVRHLSRKANPQAEFPAYQWDISKSFVDKNAFEGVDVVVHLAGAGLADRRWTKSRKKEIIDSRVVGTNLLVRTISALSNKPQAFISASAIGYYGDTGDRWLDEKAPRGEGDFKSECCVLWEKSAEKIADLGIRLAILRVGIVLSTQGGALQKMMVSLPFGVASYFGDGEAYYSWIHLDDICQIFLKAVSDEQIRGVYNAVSPHPAKNKDLMKALIKASGRRAALIPAPSFALRLAMGEMACIVLDSNRVSPNKIMSAGFKFQHPDLSHALKDLLSNKK